MSDYRKYSLNTVVISLLERWAYGWVENLKRFLPKCYHLSPNYTYCLLSCLLVSPKFSMNGSPGLFRAQADSFCNCQKFIPSQNISGAVHIFASWKWTAQLLCVKTHEEDSMHNPTILVRQVPEIPLINQNYVSESQIQINHQTQLNSKGHGMLFSISHKDTHI